MCLPPSASGFSLPERAMRKIFSQSGETDFSLFRAFRPRAAGFKQNKSLRRPSSPAKRSGHELANQPRRCPDIGASDGISWSFARMACRHTCLRHGLVRTSAGPCGRNADDARHVGADSQIRRAVRAVRFAAVRRRRAGKMAAGSSASSTTKGCSWRFATATANAACLRRRFNSSPSWTMRGPARDAPASARSIARSISRSGR